MGEMEYKTNNDKELWECCQSQSDERAYNELFKRYFPRMLRIAMHYVKDSVIAEEIVMDGFINLWNKRREIMDNNFLNYLFRCVRNSVISYFRKKVPEILALEHAERVCQADLSTDHRVLFRDVLQTYYAALKKLSPRRRQVFRMSREEELTYNEIAKKLNLSVGTVENYMMAALDGLRANMKKYVSIFLIILYPIM